MKILVAVLLISMAGITHASEPDWHPWSPETFDKAAEQDRFVFLYLEAVWCHWCHVMQKKTLQDEEVISKLEQHYLPVKVDHDAHPALADRYRAWGWPALIFLAPDGTEIVKRAGYIAPDPFSRLLSAIVRDPTPEPAAIQKPPEPASSPLLDDELRQTLKKRHQDTYDSELGGLDIPQKYIERDSLEYALVMAAEGDATQGRRARKTLDAAMALLDPVWGGFYQYSTGGRWDNPHYEKIMRSQAGVLRSYAHAYALFQRDADRLVATAIRDYLFNFLRSPEGAFYVSQDADLIPGQKSDEYFALDDQARRKRGMPAIDKHLYAQQNGLAIEGLAYWHEISQDRQSLQAAIKAANWVLEHRRRSDGGFNHGQDSSKGPFLGDSLAMGRAFLQLYRSTAERRWLDFARQTSDFIINNFQAGAGFIPLREEEALVTPIPDIDQNISTVRFLNLLSHYTGEQSFRKAAEHGMRYLVSAEVALSRITEAGILLADRELANDPTHLTVVGSKENRASRLLYQVAQQQHGWYKRVEWWDRSEGQLPNHDVEYPSFEQPAGYVCTNNRCSLPSFTPDKFRKRIMALTGG